MNSGLLSGESRHFPGQSTPFIGRQRELDEITQLLLGHECRLLTLVGPGGIGKTRLAAETARQLQDVFRDGVWLVSLQSLTSPDVIVQAVAEAVGCQFFPGSEPKSQLLEHLRDQVVLIVLDNFEHLLDGADLVSDMLAYAPSLKVLATSRERLNLLDEWVLTVEGLPVPDGDSEAEISKTAAPQLFLQCARRAQVGFSLREEQRAALIRVCRAVGGMPLGIELAAGWITALSLEDIAFEIERGLDLLATSARDVPPRHRTMRVVLDHSWSLLGPDERKLLARLSAFRGGFRKEAAQRVAEANLPSLRALANKSLLETRPDGRYDLHELVWQYAREKLAESEEDESILERHLAYYVAFAEIAGRELFLPDQVQWADRIETELGNLRAAIAVSIDIGDVTSTLRLTGALYRFWAERGYYQDGYAPLLKALGLPDASSRTPVRILALHAAGYIQWYVGDSVEACRLVTEAADIARETGDVQGLAVALRTLGPILHTVGELDAGKAALEESLRLSRQLQDRYGIAWSLMFLGDVMLQAGNAKEAEQLCRESIEILKELHDVAFLAYPVRRLGVLLAKQQDYENAGHLFRESLHLNQSAGDRRGVAASLVALASLASELGQNTRAVRILGTVDALLNDLGVAFLHSDQVEFQRCLEMTRTHLDPTAFRHAWEEGQATPMATIVAVEQTSPVLLPTREANPQNEARDELLTVREIEILELMAQGMSNRAIANRLTLALGTVKWYVSQICSKLQVENRVEAIVRAREQDLLR